MKAYLEPQEIVQIENQATNPRDRLLIHVLFKLGCRISEALALKVEDFDFSQKTVIIQHLKSRIQLSCPGCHTRIGSSHLFCPKCGIKVQNIITQVLEHRRQRILPLDTETLLRLQDYIKNGKLIIRGEKRFLFGINRHRAWQIVKECAAKAGLPSLINPETGKSHNISPHKLRDAFAVHAIKLNDSGDGLRLLQEHLGHASFNTTAKYRKVSGKEHQEWYDKLWAKS
jgi:integrase/recombinase XerD